MQNGAYQNGGYGQQQQQQQGGYDSNGGYGDQSQWNNSGAYPNDANGGQWDPNGQYAQGQWNGDGPYQGQYGDEQGQWNQQQTYDGQQGQWDQQQPYDGQQPYDSQGPYANDQYGDPQQSQQQQPQQPQQTPAAPASNLNPDGSPRQFLLRISLSADLLGGWVSLKGESSLLAVHLLNYLLLDQIVKKRRINLAGLDHDQICLARHPVFERTGVEPAEDGAANGGDVGQFQLVGDEQAIGDLWKSQWENLKQNPSYKLNESLPVLFLFLRSNDLFGERVCPRNVHMRLLIPQALAPLPPAGSVQPGQPAPVPAAYLEASGKDALALTPTPTPATLFDVRHLDDFEIEEDLPEEEWKQGQSPEQAVVHHRQPIVYVRDAFHRFLGVVEPPAVAAKAAAFAAATSAALESGAPLPEIEPRDPTEVGAKVVSMVLQLARAGQLTCVQGRAALPHRPSPFALRLLHLSPLALRFSLP